MTGFETLLMVPGVVAGVLVLLLVAYYVLTDID